MQTNDFIFSVQILLHDLLQDLFFNSAYNITDQNRSDIITISRKNQPNVL